MNPGSAPSYEPAASSIGKTSAVSAVDKPSLGGTALGAAGGRFPLVESAPAGFHEQGRREDPTDSLGCGTGDRPIAKVVQLAARQLCIEGEEER
jgi:hypothetical protein